MCNDRREWTWLRNSAAVFLLITGLLLSGRAGAEDPKPPSTGKELAHPEAPAISVDDAAALRTKGLAEFNAATPDCDRVFHLLAAGLWGGTTPIEVTKQSEPEYSALATCASRTHRWLVLERVTLDLLKLDPNYPHAADLARAEIALGDFATAEKMLTLLAKHRPKDPEIAFTQALGDCELELWNQCSHSASLALKLAADAKGMNPELPHDSHKLLGEAYFHEGKFDESTTEIQTALSGQSDTGLEKKLKRNEIVKTSKLAVEPNFDKNIPLGIYHLLGRTKGTRPVLTLKLYNFTAKPRQVRIETELQGVSERVTKTKLLAPHKQELVELVPPLRNDFNVATLRADRSTQIAIKVTALDADGEHALYEKAYPVNVMPRDSLPLMQQVDADVSRPTPGFIAAWITPNAKAVDSFLQTSKTRVLGPGAGSFAGEQTATIPQVKALWDELQAEGVSYVMDPEVLSDLGYTQRTRLPTEVLQTKNAQCLEGTILFATLMEAIGLHPIIVRVPGHAFVGWHASKYDGAHPGTVYFVETTLVHTAKFEDAMRVALHRVQAEEKEGHFKRGIYGPAFMLDVATLRKQGYRPQPID